MSDIEPGQVWADNDPRGELRRVRVVLVERADGFPGEGVVTIETIVDYLGRTVKRPRLTRVSLARFQNKQTGYRLVE